MSGRTSETSSSPTLVFLAGGKGTRLQSLDSSRPKPMILVKEKPFLHWLTRHYVHLGFKDFIFSTGHLAEIIENYDWHNHFPNAKFRFSREDTPLGTGGAVQSIFKKYNLVSAWVVNADTLLPSALPTPPKLLEAFYTAIDPKNIFDASPNLCVEDDLVIAENKNGQYFDGGAVFITHKATSRYDGPVPCSIHELLNPSMVLKQVGYARVEGTCYDIGTPERYLRFEKYLESLNV